MSVLLVGLNHRTAPVRLREQLAFGEADVPAALTQVRQSGAFDGAVILSTCNRVEVYASSSLPVPEALSTLEDLLFRSHGDSPPRRKALYKMAEPHSLVHLFRVASGLDSVVLGETEILSQVKKAYDLALRHHFTGRVLNKVFQNAFHVAKQVRTETRIQCGSVSVGSVEAEVAAKIFSSLSNREVLVIGAGVIAQRTAQALCRRGARHIVVTNRSLDRAQALATSLNGRVTPFGHWDEALERANIVVVATSAPRYVLDRARLEPLLRRRPDQLLLLIDLAVPRNIDPEVRLLDHVFLYNVDDFQTLAATGLRQRETELAKCDAIIAERVCAFLDSESPLFSSSSTPVPAFA